MALPTLIKHHIYTGQPLPEPWPYDYVLDGAGLLKRASTPHFETALRVASVGVAGLPTLGASLTLKVAPVPAALLRQVVAHARQAGGGGKLLYPVEQMYHFHWLDGRWRVSLPRQQATTGQVSYAGGNALTIALDLHSHHQMGAFFSGTDNRDEQGCRLYAVLGRIYTRPEIKLRVGVYGDFMEIQPGLLFEL